jgi:spore coat polysaccharide biosynthesis predicted glycosyltransferase SpsG
VAKPTIVLATSNGIGMGHLARATAVALEMKGSANPVIVSVAGGIAELPAATGIRCEYIPGKNRGWIKRNLWDSYLQARLLAVVEETGASVISFDGVVPYPGFIATKIANPNLQLIWVRRGLWQKNALRFALPFQSRLVDKVIEPGDIARGIDKGPTSRRKDAHLTSPVSLFSAGRAKSRSEARSILGLDQVKPAVLVQLGTGDGDMNEKMRAALTGLLGWRDLQVVLTKNPVDENGNSLVPEGLTVKVVRYFPLADLLFAFDGAIAATGYNSVHELLPAAIPTVFVSNIRGTDDQDARAHWCHENGYALRANHADLADITHTVSQLIDESVRTRLHSQCAALGDTSGGSEIAQILIDVASNPINRVEPLIRRILRGIAVISLRLATYLYRKIRPQEISHIVSKDEVLYSSETEAEFLRSAIKGNRHFEHLIADSSKNYLEVRRKIANRFRNI